MGHYGRLKERRIFLKDNNFTTPELIYNQSIVKKYFIEGKIKFTELV